MLEVETYTLDYLYKSGFIDTIRNYYLTRKEEALKGYPFISKYDDETMVVYLSYYFLSITYQTDEYLDLSEAITKHPESIDNIHKLAEFIDGSFLEWIKCLYEKDECTDKEAQSKYNSYFISMNSIYQDNKLTDRFMKDNYNSVFESTVRTYFYHNKLCLEKIGLDVSDQNLYQTVIYCLYTMLSEVYSYEYKKNRKKLMKYFRTLSYDEAVEMTNYYLSFLDEQLVSKEEYMEQRSIRVHNATEIVETANNELKRLSKTRNK